MSLVSSTHYALLELIQELSQSGQDIVLSTHEMGFAKAVADQVAFVAAGQALEMAPPKALFQTPHTEACKRFLSRVMRY
jgi:polar amino acid transport system ATP-binding protein